MLDFWDKLIRCYLCDEQWFEIYGHKSWYLTYNKWVADGKCNWLSQGLGHFEKIVPPDVFYLCMEEWRRSGDGDDWKD